MTDLMEINFYGRCSPEQRPVTLRGKFPDAKEDEDSVKVDTVEDKLGADEKSAEGSSTPPIVDGQVPRNYSSKPKKGSKKPIYDASLVKALHTTFFIRWWTSGLLKLFSGECLKKFLLDSNY